VKDQQNISAPVEADMPWLHAPATGFAGGALLLAAGGLSGANLALAAVLMALGAAWAVQMTDQAMLHVINHSERASLSVQIRSESLLLTDLYQLTMLQVYFDRGMNQTAVFEFFVRKMPENRNFFVAAGLEQVLDYLEGLRFTDEELKHQELFRRIEAAGAVLSEFPFGRRADRQSFAMRNRIISGLSEGVVVCNQRHQVVLYNSVAMEMLSQAGQLGLGRQLFETIAREPVVHMHDLLTHRPELGGKGTPFLAGSVDGHMLLQARMTLIRSADGEPSGYVVTLVDAGPQVAALATRDVLLREITEGLESPLIRLRVAAANPVIAE